MVSCSSRRPALARCSTRRPPQPSAPSSKSTHAVPRTQNTRSRFRDHELRPRRALHHSSVQVTSGADHDHSPKRRWATVFNQNDLTGQMACGGAWRGPVCAAGRLGRNAAQTTWATGREVSNVPWTAVALSYAKAVGGECHGRSGGIIECMVDDFPGYGAQVTIGNVVFNTTGERMKAERLAHETKHADQWALFGLDFAVDYLVEQEVVGECNFWEWWAGFDGGGYSQC
jgi:hypothetical protein